MSSEYIKIEGATIRQALRSKGLPGGNEQVCCGGKRTFSKNYKTQLQRLGMRGKYIILERGIYSAKVEL